MYKLINDKGKVLFESHYEMSNNSISLADNSYYRFVICADCCDIESTLYINDRAVKTIQVEKGKSSSIGFRTKVNDSVYIHNVRKCIDRSNLIITSKTIPSTCNEQGVANITVSGGQAPYSYLWDIGSTTADIQVPSGTYTVVVTDSASVSASHTVTVVSNSISVTETIVDSTAANGSINLSVSGGTLPYTYLWSNGETTKYISDLAPGTYSVTITDNKGCTYNNSFNVSFIAPTVQSLSDVTICSTDTIQSIPLLLSAGATANITGGTSIGVSDQVGVTSIPTFNGIVGSATITVTPVFMGLIGTPVTFTYEIEKCLQAFTFDITGFDENNSNGGVNRASFEIAATSGYVDWGDGLTTPIINGVNTHNYSSNGARTISVYDIDGAPTTLSFNLGSFNVNNLDVSNYPLVQAIFAQFNKFTEIPSFSNNPVLRLLQFQGNLLTSFNSGLINSNVSNLSLNFFNNSLSPAAVNSILINIDSLANLGAGDLIQTNGGTNASPTGAGLIAKNSIISKGASCFTN